MQLDIPEGDFEGYIFDCDGTLADSMPVHYHAWCAAVEHFSPGTRMPEDLFYHLGGMPTRRVVEVINAELDKNFDPDITAEYKEQQYLNLLHTIKPIEQVLAYARECAGRGLSVAVASGGMPQIVRLTLELIGARDIFPDQCIITAADVERGKPAPDMFLLAAQRMGVPPEACLVFEDGEMGFRAAAAAGMAYVKVPSRVD